MQELEGKLLELVEAIETGVVEYGPEALDIALALIQIHNVGMVGLGLVALAATVFLVRTCFRLVTAYNGQYEEVGYRANDALMMGGVVTGVVSIFTGGAAAYHLLNIWHWVGVFAPKLRLAYDIYQKVVG